MSDMRKYLDIVVDATPKQSTKLNESFMYIEEEPVVLDNITELSEEELDELTRHPMYCEQRDEIWVKTIREELDRRDSLLESEEFNPDGQNMQEDESKFLDKVQDLKTSREADADSNWQPGGGRATGIYGEKQSDVHAETVSEDEADEKWNQQFNETVQRMKMLAGLKEDDVYAGKEFATTLSSEPIHPNEMGNDSAGGVKFGDDSFYGGKDEGPFKTKKKTTSPGEGGTPKAPIEEAEEVLDEEAFTYKMAEAALEGKANVEIGGMNFAVRMPKDKAEQILNRNN